jgi:hypothetical protein
MHKYTNINNTIKSLHHEVFIGNFQTAQQNLGLQQIIVTQLYENIDLIVYYKFTKKI